MNAPAAHDAHDDVTRLHAELAAERATLDRLAKVATSIVSERDPDRLMQRLVDEATALVGASFGAFFDTVPRQGGPVYQLYTLSGAPREAFERFGMPRSTALFAPTFRGEEVVRADDVTRDPRYGGNAPHHGMPAGHLPVKSYLAVPVRSVGGQVLGGLLFGHPEPAVFGEREERAAVALAAIASGALDGARLHAQLAAANVRHRLVDEATREGIWYWDVPTNVVEWNDALLAAMGLERDGWRGRFEDWFERVHPDDQPVLGAALTAHLERRVPYRIELFRLRHASGAYRWFTTVGQAEWGDDGKPLRMAGSVRDVHDRELAAEALRASEHRSAQLLESVGDVVFCKDATSRIVWANAAARRSHGVGDGAPLDAIDRDPSAARDDRRVFEEGAVVEREDAPRVDPDGRVRLFHTVKTPIHDAEGRVVELVAVSRDVTERKRDAEGQRRLAEASAILTRSIDYEETIANVARAVVPELSDWCAIDVVEDGAIRRIAVAHPEPEKVELAYRLERKYPADPASPHGVHEVVRTGRAQMMPHVPDELLVQGARDADHLALLRALGLATYIVVPLKAHDRVLGAITLVGEGARRFDARDLRLAEELATRVSGALENALLYREVRELNVSLERRVAERTAALVEANEELESFSYTVSHDLRAPIRHIGGFADLLRVQARGALDAKGTHYLETIKNAATQMGALIDGLLAFSRLGRADLAKRRVDLGETVRDVVASLAPDTEGRVVHWEVGALPVVQADPTMLRLVLTNLLANAVKYTRQRAEAHVAVTATTRDDDLVVTVADDGAGFDMAFAHKLFGVFQRLHAAEDFEGTGIGLATARRIVGRHGGRIWAEGVPGQGARFSFTLPLERAPLSEPK